MCSVGQTAAPGREDGLAATDGVIAWMHPGEVALCVQAFRRDHYTFALLVLAPLIVVILVSALLGAAVVAIISLLFAGIVSRYGWVIERDPRILVTNERVIVIRTMGPQYLGYDSMRRVAVTRGLVGRAFGFADVTIEGGELPVRIAAVKNPTAVAQAIARVAGEMGFGVEVTLASTGGAVA